MKYRIVILIAGAVWLHLLSGQAQAVDAAASGGQVLELRPLVEEAIRNNHEVLLAEARQHAAIARIRPAGSLPDPMIMVGYQNEGWSENTLGKMPGAQWMYSVSQMFPFPGKRSLKEQMAEREADSAEAMLRSARLAAVARVKELYFDLVQVHKDLEVVRERAALFRRVEEAALARYATGMSQQQEVLMAQTEKYMLLERETMLRQKQRTLEAMLHAALGRHERGVLGIPAAPPVSPLTATEEDLVKRAEEASPEVASRERMHKASQAGTHMAEKEYFPDVTLTGTVARRGGDFPDMWSVTAAFSIPLWYRSRQSESLASARAMANAAAHELDAAKTMIASGIQDNYAMARSAEQLMELYRTGLIPKTTQDFELSLSGYRTGKVEGVTVLSRLKALLDYETAYWAQYVAREKAIARLEALSGGTLDTAQGRTE